MLQKMKVYTIDAMSSNSMKSKNQSSGIHETQTTKCLDTMCLDPSCNQGGHMVVIALEGNGARPSHMGDGYKETDTMYTLNTIEQHSVCYDYCLLSKQLSTAMNVVPSLEATDYKEPCAVCFSVDCRNNVLNEEISATLQAKEQGGWSVNVTNPVLYEKSSGI